MKTEDILAERGSRYGSYADNALIMQELKRVMRQGKSWDSAPDTVKEALECIALKIGRIVNGDPMYPDSWEDLCGYSTLVLKEIAAVADDKPVRARTLDPAPNATTPEGLTIRQRTVDPMPAGPPDTEPTDASHAVEPMVPRYNGTPAVHLTPDHVGMFFRLVDTNQSPVRLERNDGPEPDRYPFKAHNRRYTEYGFCAAADGLPLHDIIAFHPH